MASSLDDCSLTSFLGLEEALSRAPMVKRWLGGKGENQNESNSDAKVYKPTWGNSGSIFARVRHSKLSRALSAFI